MDFSEYDRVPEDNAEPFMDIEMKARVEAPKIESLKKRLETIMEVPETTVSSPTPVDVIAAIETIKHSVNLNEAEAERTLREVKTDLITCLVRIERQLNKKHKKEKSGRCTKRCNIM